MTHRKYFWCLSFLLLVSACGGSRSQLKVGKTAEGEVVEAEGVAVHDPKDVLSSKKASLADAQKNAVEKVVGVIVSAKTLVEKAVAIENNILSRTEGYIKKFDVLKEYVDEGFYKTRIRALVAFKDLEADLKNMSLLNMPELKRPRVYVQLSETIDRDGIEENPAQSSLAKSLSDQGYTIVASSSVGGTDIVVTGKGSSSPFQTEKLGGFISYRARLSLTAKKVGTNSVLFSFSKEASGLGGNNQLAGFKSLETVGQLAGEELGLKLAEKFGKGQILLVRVEGVTSFKDVEKVRKHLSSQPGVQDLVLRFFEEGTAHFEVQLGSLQPSELAAHLETSQSLPLKVLESSNQDLRLKLTEAK